jgi:O-methyltransferase
LEFVLNYLKIIGVNDAKVNKIKFIKGFIPESLVEFPKVSIAFLNLDLDLYLPTLDALNFFWKYMSTGGIILLDDYDSNSVQLKWPGVKLAVDEFCELNKTNILRCIGNQAYLKK